MSILEFLDPVADGSFAAGEFTLRLNTVHSGKAGSLCHRQNDMAQF
jgi:hypothetical protein